MRARTILLQASRLDSVATLTLYYMYEKQELAETKSYYRLWQIRAPQLLLILFRIGPVDEIDLTQVFRILWRGKLWIFLSAITAIIIGGYYAFAVATPLFTANSVVMLDSREEQVVDLESVMTGLSGDVATINTEVEVIRSRGLIEKLVLKLDLVNDPEFNETLRPEPKYSLGAGLIGPDPR